MLALFIPLVFIWLVATLTSGVCLLMAVNARYALEGDERKVPHYLRFTYLWGFTALGCVAISALLITADFLVFRHSLLTLTQDQWLDYATSCYALGPFAAINVLPSGICWIWFRRRYGAEET